jgi:predicted DNA-binding transcriptional regulator YafY
MDAMRLWLIANIENVQVEKDIFNRDENFDLHKYAANSFGVFQEDPINVELEFIPEVAEDVQNFHFHDTQTIEELPSGKIKVTFTAGGLTEMCWHLFTWGSRVKIIQPSELKNRFETMCKEIIGE